MIDWILANQALFNAGVSAVTVIIWMIYAQLLYFGFRRQRTPRVLINRGRKKSIDGLCIISNMSQEAIYVEYILATLETSHGKVVMDVTDFEHDPTEEQEDGDGHMEEVSVISSDLHENTRQGPLHSGEFMHIGTFGGVIRRLAREAEITMRGNLAEGDIQLKCLTIELIVMYGPEPRPVSASRSFYIDNEAKEGTLVPASWRTRQRMSFLQRRRLSRRVDKMNQANFTVKSTVRLDKN